jgi:hypothetical protein
VSNQIDFNTEVNNLKAEFIEQCEKPVEHNMKLNKMIEISSFKPLYDKNHYNNLVYVTTDINDIKNLEIELEYVDSSNPDQMDLWMYFRVFTSSLHGSQPQGRNIKILVKEKHTKKYLGIIGVSSTVRTMGERDKYIGWTPQQMKERRVAIMDIYCCVGLRPMSYNLNLGKLLAQIPFSKEFQEYYHKKYLHYVAGFVTTSINGKSIQYNDVKYLNFVGYTKGNGTSHIPEHLYKKAKNLLNQYESDVTYILDKQTSELYGGKYQKMQRICDMLGISKKILHHDNARGIYFGFTGKDSQDFLQMKKDTFEPQLTSLKDIIETWKTTHAIKRFTGLHTQNKLLTKTELDWFLKRVKNGENVKEHYRKKIDEIGIDKFRENNTIYMEQYRQNKKERKFIDFELDNLDDNKYKLYINENYKHFTLSESYLGGFFDGDGTVYIAKDIKRQLYDLEVRFTQDWFPILHIIHNKFGGVFSSYKKCKTYRTTYDLRFTGQSCYDILQFLQKGCITKLKQINCAIEYYKLLNQTNKNDERDILYHKLGKLKKELPKDNKLPYDRINYDYIAGIFDAEGCAMLKKHAHKQICVANDVYEYKFNAPEIEIKQKNSVYLLNGIKDYLKCGTVDINSWASSNSTDIKLVIDKIIFKTCVKRLQLQTLLEALETFWIDNKKTKYTLEVHNIRKQTNSILTDEKLLDWKIHKNALTSLNHIQNKINKVNSLKIKHIKYEKNKATGKELIACDYCARLMSKNAYNRHLKENCKENTDIIAKQNIARKQSEYDPVYHKAKIARTNYFKKRSYTDDRIREIQKIFGEQPNTQIQSIAYKYKMDRNVVSKIKSGEIIPLDNMSDKDIDEYFIYKILNKNEKKITKY